MPHEHNAGPDFQQPRGRLARRRRGRTNVPHDETVVLDKVCAQCEKNRRELACDLWSTAALDAIEHEYNSWRCQWPTENGTPAVWVLGLGSLEESVKSRLQLALFEQLARRLRIEMAQVCIYDPVTSAVDRAALERAGIVRHENVDFVECQGPTLFYMLHCPTSLYEELLARVPSARHTMLIGNDLRMYADALPGPRLAARYPHIASATVNSQFVSSLLPEWPIRNDVFNNTAVQWFRSEPDTGPPEKTRHESAAT